MANKDLKQQVDDLEKKVKSLENLMNVGSFARETRITGLMTIENTAIFRMIPDDADTTTNAQYGEMFVDSNLIKYFDSTGEERSAGSYPSTELTASGAIASDAIYVELNSVTPLIAATIAAPEAGRSLVITQTDAGTAGHTVTLTGGTYDGSNTIATFNAQEETLVLFGVSATRFVIVENVGAVALS